ncbi:MAG: PKD domain-containing protein [Actinomycetota bacterium]|nr:PKD domain-containing protein [Actinomycetota bacterium]
MTTFGQEEAPGVEAVVFSFDEQEESTWQKGTPAIFSSQPSTGGVPAARGPVVVALSPHGCLPVYGVGGVDISSTFSEANSADCVSFIAPTPEPDAAPAKGKKQKTPKPTPEELASALFDRAIALAARPDLQLAPGVVGMTGLPSYFWLGNAMRPIVASAGVGGFVVTAEAGPVQYRWTFGDGSTLTTSHPGRPWTRSRPGNIAHLYERSARYEVSVDVIWEARWRVGGGPWQPLGFFRTSDEVPYPVRQMIAALTEPR